MFNLLTSSYEFFGYTIGLSCCLVIVVVIVLIVLGIVYLVKTISSPKVIVKHEDRREQSRNCPSCGRSIPFDANICPYCGKNFEEKDK